MAGYQILNQLSTAVDAIQITEDMADAIARSLKETHKKAQLAKDREIDGFRAALVELDKKEDRICDLRASDELDAPAFKRQQARLRAERDPGAGEGMFLGQTLP